jgi:hypothetical protein
MTVGADDILLVRTGLVRRLVQLGAWDATKANPTRPGVSVALPVGSQDFSALTAAQGNPTHLS